MVPGRYAVLFSIRRVDIRGAFYSITISDRQYWAAAGRRSAGGRLSTRIQACRKTMDLDYKALQTRARELADALPQPNFYRQFEDLHRFSKQFLKDNSILLAIRRFVSQTIDRDFGHGMQHACKVSRDAGVLALIMADSDSRPADLDRDRLLLLVQTASLLHDIKRKEKNHAREGARYAGIVLKAYPFSTDEVTDIRLAIGNHEAFQPTEPCRSDRGCIISDCLYDADKFRWGPDNFTDTIWEMLTCMKIPPAEFIRRYPRGIQSLEKIKATFRTPSGKKFGPQMIDLGIRIGNTLMAEVDAGEINV